MIQSVVFYLVSGILVFSALMVVTQRNLFTCALYLASALSMVAALFVLLGADFLAAVQILLYVGGVLVIIVFTVMLSSLDLSKIQPQINEQWFPSLLVCLTIFLMVVIGLKRNPFSGVQANLLPTTQSIGQLLLQNMKLPFEAVSLILLASLVGAVLFSRKQLEESEK